MLLAQVTDTHVLGLEAPEESWVDHNARLAQAVTSLNDERPAPDVVLLTGDLTNNGEPGEIEALRSLVGELRLPVLALPGNHDDRAEIKASFDMDWAADDNLSWQNSLGGLNIIGLDTTVPGFHHGDFDAAREEWLRGALAESGETPTVVAMHHPPFASGIAWMDRSMLRRADVFIEVVASHANVTRILCGHLHRQVTTAVGGVLTSVGPSTVHHIHLDTTPGGVPAIICDPVGYQLHSWDGTNWVTHTRYIDTGQEAIVPSWSSNHDG